MDAFVAAAAGKDAALRIGRGGCFERHATREPYMPVLDAIERLAHAPDGAAIVALLRRFAPSWLAQLPGLTAGGEVHPPQGGVRPERMGREFAAWTEAVCAVAPLLLVLEDLHWSDPSTIDLLSFLGTRGGSVRLMVLATYRPAEVPSPTPSTGRRATPTSTTPWRRHSSRQELLAILEQLLRRSGRPLPNAARPRTNSEPRPSGSGRPRSRATPTAP